MGRRRHRPNPKLGLHLSREPRRIKLCVQVCRTLELGDSECRSERRQPWVAAGETDGKGGHEMDSALKGPNTPTVNPVGRDFKAGVN
jgi:hypothetical protein